MMMMMMMMMTMMMMMMMMMLDKRNSQCLSRASECEPHKEATNRR